MTDHQERDTEREALSNLERYLRDTMETGTVNECIVARTSLRLLQAARSQQQQQWRLPKEPPPGLLVSMAIRLDHGLGVPGYYDQPMFTVKGLTHAQRLASAMRSMRQLYEEVSGHGFYSPEKEADYAAMIPPALSDLTGGGNG